MKVGDLVKPKITCGGSLRSVRCSSAIVVKVYPALPAGSPPWRAGADGREYDAYCSCGIWEEYEYNLELIK